ncbi:MAG TPA: ATP-binding protein [Ktedonobacterales bacterium]|nr:ATP-binding protein [Ktedonobacterales bacterium]
MAAEQPPAHRTALGRPPLLVIVSGAPCTGKTTLAARLAADLRLPLIAKDTVKETLFDALGWSDREWSRRLGGASVRLLFVFAEAVLRAGRPAVLESNFSREWDTPHFAALRERVAFEPLQIVCTTERETLLARFAARWVAGERHPGHVEAAQLPELAAALDDGRYGALPIGGEALTLDTTDFAAVIYDVVRAAVAGHLRP